MIAVLSVVGFAEEWEAGLADVVGFLAVVEAGFLVDAGLTVDVGFLVCTGLMVDVEWGFTVDVE